MSALLQKCEQLIRASARDGELGHVFVCDEWPNGKKPVDETGLPIRYPKTTRLAQAFVGKNHASRPRKGDYRLIASARVPYDASLLGAQGAANVAVLEKLLAKLEGGDWDDEPKVEAQPE